jgi:hypothetical protein
MNKEYQTLKDINNIILVKIKDELEKRDTNLDSVELLIGFKGVIDTYIYNITSSEDRKRMMSRLKEK